MLQPHQLLLISRRLVKFVRLTMLLNRWFTSLLCMESSTLNRMATTTCGYDYVCPAISVPLERSSFYSRRSYLPATTLSRQKKKSKIAMVLFYFYKKKPNTFNFLLNYLSSICGREIVSLWNGCWLSSVAKSQHSVINSLPLFFNASLG